MLQRIDVNSLENMTSSDKKSLIEGLLRSTNRQGVENVINFLNSTDFYIAPASTKYHSNYREGLVNHSLTVLELMRQYRDMWVMMKPELASKLTDESLIICSILHDLCKCNLYSEQQKMVKDDRGDWTTKMVYVYNDTFPIGHGEKSVIMLQAIGMPLNFDEMLAIRYHMAFWGDLGTEAKASLHAAIEMSSLVSLIQIADYAASNIFETVKK